MKIFKALLILSFLNGSAHAGFFDGLFSLVPIALVATIETADSFTMELNNENI